VSARDSADFQRPYLRPWLNFIGVSDIQEIDVPPTLTDAEDLARAVQSQNGGRRTRHGVLSLVK
jgi:hypothetical protein